MTSTPITIRNVYIMMAYAFRGIRMSGTDRIAGEHFEHLHDLLAEILAQHSAALIKRGLHRDYVLRSDDLATVRGRIDVHRSIATRSMTRARLVCEFDEYELDTPHNRALKAAISLLLRQGAVSEQRKSTLRGILGHLEPVSLVDPRSIHWGHFIYHRINSSYRMPLGVCELIVKGLLPDRSDSGSPLTAWVSDEAMSTLYERFVLEYYRLHHPEYDPRAKGIRWQYEQDGTIGADQLPAMRTDVTLRHGNRSLIIDTKYYRQSMQIGRFGRTSYHSGNLYQMLSYVKNADIDRDGSVSGMLLYARTNASAQPNLDVTMQGNRIGARTLDLNRPWSELREQLEGILDWLGPAHRGSSCV